MARIRAIKPEFWSSPSLPDDPWARLLYMAMWNWADDKGVGTALPRELLGFAFPNDEHITLDVFRRMLEEIHRVFGVKFYTVAGRPYYAIPSWETHQKFDRRSNGKYPGPEHAETWLYQQEHQKSAETHESTSSTRRDYVAGTGEEGTGEQYLKTLDQPQAVDRVRITRFEEFWAAYPRKVGKQKAQTKYTTQAKTHGEETIITGAHRFANDPNLPETQFIPHPTTWLERGSWADEPLPTRSTGTESQASRNLNEVMSWDTPPDDDWLQIEG